MAHQEVQFDASAKGVKGMKYNRAVMELIRKEEEESEERRILEEVMNILSHSKNTDVLYHSWRI